MKEDQSDEFSVVAFLTSPSIKGLLSILFGSLALLFLGIPQMSMVLVFGAYSLLESALAILRFFRKVDWPGDRWLLLLESILDLVIAALVFAFPSFWSIALPWLIAAWAMMTGAIHLVGSIRYHAREDKWWIPPWAGEIRVVYGVLAWLVPVTLPNVGNMSGHFVAFLVLTGIMAILSGAVILVWGTPSHRGSAANGT